MGDTESAARMFTQRSRTYRAPTGKVAYSEHPALNYDLVQTAGQT